MTRKLVTLLLAVLVVLGCAPSPEAPPTAEQPADTLIDAPTDAPTEEPTEAPTEVQTAEGATLIVSEGTVTVSTNGDDGQAYTAGDETMVAVGATLRTEAASEATLFFLDGAVVTLNPGTTLTLTEFSETSSPFVVRLNLEGGSIINRVARVLGVDDLYEITTPTGSATVRGTVFTVEVINDQHSEFTTQEGVITVTFDDETVEVSAGESVSAEVGRGIRSVPDVPAPTQGTDGTTGSTGGTTGGNGDNGNTGDNGDNGNTGDNGDNGNTGGNGDNGDNGNTGGNGDNGSTGGGNGSSDDD